MFTLRFPIELDDCFLIYTGGIVACTDGQYLAKYYEPTVGKFLNIELRRDQIIDRGYSETGELPLSPVVVMLPGKTPITQHSQSPNFNLLNFQLTGTWQQVSL